MFFFLSKTMNAASDNSILFGQQPYGKGGNNFVRYVFSYFIKHLSRIGDIPTSDGEYADCRPKYQKGKSRDTLLWTVNIGG